MDGFVYGELVEIVQLWEESGDPGDYLWQEYEWRVFISMT